jgi:predicted short-subunit dehydrogenase-like oxidoreductase (DUF2520 family)
LKSNPTQTITFIGAGRLAMSLGRLWHQGHVLTIGDVFGRSRTASTRAVAAIGAGHAVDNFADLGAADLFLIATPDRAVVSATEQLLGTGVVNSNSVVFHCSGAESSHLLDAARSRGAAVASAHPLTSFSDQLLSAGAFAGVFCAIEGDPAATAGIAEIFSAIGARPINITAEQKILYHAAAVFGSNYLVTLLQLALDGFALAGIEAAVGLAMLEPLVRQTVDNVFLREPRAALTGPIARGDLELVRRQYLSLEAANPSIAAIYRILGERTAQLAGCVNPFAPDQAANRLDLL